MPSGDALGAERAQRRDTLFASPTAQERISLVLGPQRARELEAMLRVEGIMDRARVAVTGNSSTALQLITAGAAGAGGGYATGYDPTTSGIATTIAAFARHRLDQRVAARVADMLISHDPRVVDRGVKMIAHNERFMSVLRQADAALARAVGTQAGRRAP